jgi:hypothetical protein
MSEMPNSSAVSAAWVGIARHAVRISSLPLWACFTGNYCSGAQIVRWQHNQCDCPVIYHTSTLFLEAPPSPSPAIPLTACYDRAPQALLLRNVVRILQALTLACKLSHLLTS